MLSVSHSNRDPSAEALPLLRDWVLDQRAVLWVQCFGQRLHGPTVRAEDLDATRLPDGQMSDLMSGLRRVFQRTSVLPDDRPVHRLMLVHNAQENGNDLSTRGRGWAHLPTGLLITTPAWRWRVDASAQRLGMPVWTVDALRVAMESAQLRRAVDEALPDVPLGPTRDRARL